MHWILTADKSLQSQRFIGLGIATAVRSRHRYRPRRRWQGARLIASTDQEGLALADEIPKNRFTRGLAIMKLAARELPVIGERLVRGRKLDEADKARMRESAERAVKILGDLRGLALKVGQTVSYVDGLLPPEATEIYQKALSKLQS